MSQDIWAQVRENIIGRDAQIDTPFGKRLITYADYTASGRGLEFIENYLGRLLEYYANTHTEDDATGMITTQQMHKAESTIKRLLNAGPEYVIIEAGSGTTGAVHRLQQILGIYIPPAGKALFHELLGKHLASEQRDQLEAYLLNSRPVVFVGPYEHHSNEVSWRECFAEVVEIDLDHDGLLDLEDLETKLSRQEYQGRRLIGAFSAASNVSGVITPVFEVARVLHRHGAMAFFDYAAIAPYGKIDVCRDTECYFDGIYFSPHKFLGGPGSSGVLIIHKGVYREDLPPTVGAGGTVDYVSISEQAYSHDIETREKPGTPGILQMMRASLALELKEALGVERIAAREKELMHRAIERFLACPSIEIMGNPDPDLRIPIFSFNVRVEESYLHPRFVTILLNDLFGIQSRAGCSCAGPYGHRLLHIDGPTSLRFKDRLLHGFIGLKPGWVRINFHYLMTDPEYDFIMAAICFVSEFGKYFLSLYDFDVHTGAWHYRDHEDQEVEFGLKYALTQTALPSGTSRPTGAEESAHAMYDRYLAEALRTAEKLREGFSADIIETTERDLIPFVYVSGDAAL